MNILTIGMDMLDNKVIGERLKKLRKASGMSQTELSKILNCDQASISRLESGIQGTSATQLVKLAQTYGVDLNSIATGQINYWGVSRKFNRKPKLKKRYQSYLESYGREVLPIIKFLRHSKGEEYTTNLLETLGLSDLAFIPPDEKISIRCLLDLVQCLIKDDIDLVTGMDKWVAEYNSRETFGVLIDSFESVKNPFQVTHLLVNNNNLIDSIFNQSILEYSDNHLILTMKKRSYLQGVDLENTKIGSVLLQQKHTMHEKLPELFSGKSLNGSFIKEFKKNLTGEAILKLEAA